ncbi:hypothetical protein REPUB_Repub11eG0068800 [Reevesia pubescens]
MLCLGDSAGMDDFNEFIFSCNLVDIPLIGKKFTWFGREKKRSKLDRFLISEDLFAGFPNLVVKALNKNLSDHVPLVLQWHCRNWGPKPFRYFNWWSECQGYFDVVASAWLECAVVGWGGFRLFKKMKAVKVSLKAWAGKNAIKHWQRTNEIEEDLDSLLVSVENSEESSLWNEDVFNFKTKCLWEEYNHLESMWRQKSRIRWLKDGDQNTRCFHSACNSRLSHNSIHGLFVEGVWIDDPEMLSWKIVCSPKSVGGLGIINLKQKNLALLGKWYWRFATDDNALWKKLLTSKYNVTGRVWCLSDFPAVNCSYVWKNIIALSFDSDLTVLLRRENFFWELGQGSKLSFWLDCWCSDVPLVVLFPRLFSICLLKEGSVAEFFSNDRWVVPLRRRLFQWECSDLEALLSKMENLKPTSLRGDRLVWKGCKKGILTSKDLYLSFFPVLNSVLKKWWPHLWHLKIPSKVQVFLWQISHDCIPCNAFLIRRHIIPENTFCCRCLTGVEDCFHVIFDCPLSLAVWNVFVSWWGCELPRVSDCTGLLLWTMETFHQECFKNCWHLATSALLHTLWSYRNKVLFDKALWDSDVIFQVIVRSSFAWGNARLKEQISSFYDWSSSPRTSVIFSP